MSDRHNIALKLKPIPIPKPQFRQRLSGEFTGNLGGSDSEISIAQKGVANGLFKAIHVYGLDPKGTARTHAQLTLDEDDTGHVNLTLTDDQSAIETMCQGIAHAIIRKRRLMTAQGLTPTLRFEFTDAIQADPDYHAQLRNELGLSFTRKPKWQDGADKRQTLTLTNAADPGLRFTFYESF